MISVGSRDGSKGIGSVLDMDEIELEEGEALCYHNGDEDSTIDPDVALSYIEEKLQNVLGHFQKDFKGGVSAKNLGAKFGGYGSFLPTYQRFPSWSHKNGQPEVHNSGSPRSQRKRHLEDRKQSWLVSSTTSPSVKPSAASGKTSSLDNSLKRNINVPSRHADESKCGVGKTFVNLPNHRSLKVRIKVVSENLSTQKNAEIYGGLGLVVSPSSSLGASPATKKGQCGKVLDLPEESPICILKIMTTFPRSLISPLSEELIHLTEKVKSRVKSEYESADKTSIENSVMLANGSRSGRSSKKVLGQKKMKSCERNNAFPIELTNQRNCGDQDTTGFLFKKEKETDFDTLACEELVTNALKLPLLSNSQYTVDDPATAFHLGDSKDGVKEETFSSVIKKESMDHESVQNIGRVKNLRGKMGSTCNVLESKKENLVNSIATRSQQDVLKAEISYGTHQAEKIVSKGMNDPSAETADPSKYLVVQKGGLGSECLNPAPEGSSNGVKRKQKGVFSTDAERASVPKDELIVDCSIISKSGKSTNANGTLSKTDSHNLPKDHEKPGHLYKDFFGDIEFEEGDNESISGEIISSGRLENPKLVGERSLTKCYSTANQKCNAKNYEMPRHPEKAPTRDAQMAPALVNGMNSEAPTGMVPLVHENEEWVFCDKCEKWRLLPLGTNPKSLSDKWHCRMLTWLPGMNRCSIPEAVTTNALRAIYHPVASVPIPASETQRDWINSSVPTSVGVASVDSRYGQEHQNSIVQDATINGKKKQWSTNATKLTARNDSNNSSNSRKKNLPTYGNDNSLHGGNISPFQDTHGYEEPSSDIEKQNSNKRDKKVPLVSSSDKGSNLKIGSKRESNLDGSRASKKMKGEKLRYDENWNSDNGEGEAFSKSVGGSATGLANSASGSDQHKYTNHKDSRGNIKMVLVVNPELHVQGTSDERLLHPYKFDDKKESPSSQIHTDPISNSGRRSQDNGDLKVMCENDHLKEKKTRVSKSEGKDTSGSKGRVETDKKSTKKQPNGNLTNTPAADNLNIDIGSIQNSKAANSSWSKVSVSHKNKTSAHEVKGSAVESVSSSPTRLPNCYIDGTSRSDMDKYKTKASDFSHDALDRMHLSEEKSKSRRNNLDEKSVTPGKTVNLVGNNDAVEGTLSKNTKGQSQKASKNRGGQDVKSQDKKHSFSEKPDDENLPMQSKQAEVHSNRKSHSLPSFARVQTETVSGSGPQKQNGVKVLAVEAHEKGNSLNAPSQSEKAENQNDQPFSLNHPIPNSLKVRVVVAPSPVRRDSFSSAVNNALKEARKFKYMADRFKGSSESTGYYFQAALKFLHGASLLESGSSEGTEQNDLMQSMDLYSSTAKLCEFCAHEYEKTKDMDVAALAYKCTEVAYMHVVYSSRTGASRERQELQTALRIIPLGESPSSSASDVDNLNHQATTDKVVFAKVNGSPQVSGSHIIDSRNRSSLLRLLNFAQDVNFAMEASRKSRMAFTAATSRLGEIPQKYSISLVKKALDFNFQDVDGLLRLVRVAMEAIGC